MWTTALLLGCTLAAQAAGANDDLKLEVLALVRQLNATRLAQREAAEQELLKLGPQVLDLLPEVNDRTPAEVKQRLGRIRQKLQRAAAEAVASPSLITLNGDALPLSKVLAALQEQSGNKIVDFRKQFGQQVTDPKLTIQLDKTPFWQALDVVLSQAGLQVYAFGEQRAISLVGRDDALAAPAEKASYAGPFRFQPLRIIAVRELQPPQSESLRLVLSVGWEPRLKPIGLRQRMADLKVLDEHGKPLAVDDTQAELEVPARGQTSAELILLLKLPPREVKQIASLKGRLAAMLPGKIETFRFGDLTTAKKVEKRIAGVTVTLEQVRQNRSLWEVRMWVRFDEAGQALESYRGWILRNEAYLQGPDGKPVPYDSLEITGQTDDAVGIAYGFVLDAAPKKLQFVYKTPGVIVDTGFDYEIKDVRLP